MTITNIRALWISTHRASMRYFQSDNLEFTNYQYLSKSLLPIVKFVTLKNRLKFDTINHAGFNNPLPS
jgi:hypothetical protein